MRRAVAGIMTNARRPATFTLPPEHVARLTGQGSGNLARFSQDAHHGTLGDLSVSLASTRILSGRALSHLPHRYHTLHLDQRYLIRGTGVDFLGARLAGGPAAAGRRLGPAGAVGGAGPRPVGRPPGRGLGEGGDGGAWLDGDAAGAITCDAAMAPVVTGEVNVDALEDLVRLCVLRDRRCRRPGGCDQPAAACQVHHTKHKANGGHTSLTGCVLFCSFHHQVAIHRWGWTLVLNPDGTTTAWNKDKTKVLHSHGLLPGPGNNPAYDRKRQTVALKCQGSSERP
jgi:hypothetical protein